MTTGTPLPAPPPRHERAADADPLAGEDEPWAPEDFGLLTPDEEDYFGLLRTLSLAVLVSAAFWALLALGAAGLLGAF